MPSEKEVDDLIDEWHTNPSIHENQKLYEFLGWTWPEYQEWVLTGKVPNA